MVVYGWIMSWVVYYSSYKYKSTGLCVCTHVCVFLLIDPRGSITVMYGY